MAILLKRAILKNGPNFFYISTYILGSCKKQFFGDHAHAGRTKYDFSLQDCIFTLKTAENAKNRRIQPKYRAHGFENGFIALPVPENPMLEKRILKLSPIGKKLGGPPTSFGRHLGFSKLCELSRTFPAWGLD